MPLYSSVLEDAGGVAFRGVFEIEFLDDAVLPPFTSKVVKSLLVRANCLEPLRRLYEGAASFRPVTLRVLRTLRGRRLYKTVGDKRILAARRGTVYIGEISAVARSPGDLGFFGCAGEEVDLGFARVHLRLREAEVRSLADLSLPETGVYRLSIHTPLLITTKILAPRASKSSRLGSLLRRAEEAYRLLPTPGYIMAQAMRQWVAMVRGEEADLSPAPYGVGRLADLLVAEFDFRLRPVTALYGRSGEGGARKVRGVTGYIVLRALHRGIVPVMSRLLAFAGLVGLGKSRSIGFGEVEASALVPG